MNILYLIGGLCLIFGSMLGYSFELRRISQLEVSFIPLILTTSYALIIYFASLLDLMKWAVLFTQAGGILLLLKNIFQKAPIKPFLYVYSIFIGISLFFLWYFYDKSFVLYDDFSHWGLISKILLMKNTINNAKDSVVLFNSYPQAAADFIYGITRIIGKTEGLMLFSQQLFILSGLLSFLSCFKKKITKIIIFIFLIVFFELYIFRLPTLSVDVLLASITFGTISFVYYYREHIGKYWIFLVPLLSALILIKNSGIFLSMIPVGLTFYYLKRWQKLKIIVILVMMILVRYSWATHVENTFDNTGKHAINFESYKEEAELKDPEILSIIKAQFKERIKKDYFIWAMVSYLGLRMIFSKERKVYGKLFVFTLTVYTIYQIGNFQMYRLSMPILEAIKLAGYDRYVKTIHLVIFAVVLYILSSMEKDENHTLKEWILPLLAGIACISFCSMPLPFEKDFVKTKIEAYRSNHIIGKEDKIVVLVNEKKTYDYYCYLVRYEFLSKNVKVLTPKNWHKVSEKKVNHIIDARE